jgi:hypothetical protein
MKELVIWAFMSVGLSNILTREFVFEWWRKWVEKTFPYNNTFNYLVNCIVCTGFWCGIATSFFFPTISWWWAGFVCSILCKIVATYTEAV